MYAMIEHRIHIVWEHNLLKFLTFPVSYRYIIKGYIITYYYITKPRYFNKRRIILPQ